MNRREFLKSAAAVAVAPLVTEIVSVPTVILSEQSWVRVSVASSVLLYESAVDIQKLIMEDLSRSIAEEVDASFVKGMSA